MSEFFKKNQLVWVKLPKLPWWPAIITEEIIPKSKRAKNPYFSVQLLGESTIAIVASSKLKDYEKNFDKHSKTSSKDLQNAIRLGQEHLLAEKLKENHPLKEVHENTVPEPKNVKCGFQKTEKKHQKDPSISHTTSCEDNGSDNSEQNCSTEAAGKKGDELEMSSLKRKKIKIIQQFTPLQTPTKLIVENEQMMGYNLTMRDIKSALEFNNQEASPQIHSWSASLKEYLQLDKARLPGDTSIKKTREPIASVVKTETTAASSDFKQLLAKSEEAFAQINTELPKKNLQEEYKLNSEILNDSSENNDERLTNLIAVGNLLEEKNFSTSEAFIATMLLEKAMFSVLGDRPDRYKLGLKILELSINEQYLICKGLANCIRESSKSLKNTCQFFGLSPQEARSVQMKYGWYKTAANLYSERLNALVKKIQHKLKLASKIILPGKEKII